MLYAPIGKTLNTFRFTWSAAVFANILAFVVSGCGSTIHRPDIGFDRPAVTATETIPYDVGIVYTDEFRSYQHTYHIGFDDHVFEVGTASVSMFNAVTRALFRSVKQLDRLPPVPSEYEELDFVIRFDKADFWFMFGSSNVFQPRPDVASVHYTVNLFTTSGELATTLHVTGHASKVPQGGTIFTIAADYGPTRARSSMESSLIDARDKFAEQLHISRTTLPKLMP